MQNLVNTYFEKFMKEKRARRRLGCVLLLLALVVGTGVYWQLRLTGAALSNETYCGITEHQHDESCYEKVLVCGLEEGEGTEGHTHSEDCYETVTTLVCGQEESEGHTHTDACYTSVLTCTLEESEGHTHSESCYDEEGNLTCGLEESVGHTHGEGCYTSELTCGLEESAGHTHSDACYETELVLICELEEVEAETGHIHTDACYEEQLVCELEEHTHTVECLIDETADVETSSDWEATIPTNLSGTWAENLVAVAKSQIGYTESTANFKLDDDGETRKGYTRYGAWAGNEYGDWDAMFVSFCLRYAGISKTDFPEATGAYAWSVTLKNKGYYASATDYTPVVGDLVFFDTDSDSKIDRVGIVIEVDEENNNKLTVVEGNYSRNEDDTDAVCKTEYASSDTKIIGYGTVSEAQKLVEGDPEEIVVASTEEATEAATEEETASTEEITEDDTDEETEIETETETESESEEESESESESESEIESESETEPESETELETETEFESETEVESKTETESESESETDTGADFEINLDSETRIDEKTGITLKQQSLVAEVNEVLIYVTGWLPAGASVTAAPVDVEIEGLNVLLAFDISISYTDENGDAILFEPENDTITVTIISSEITADNEVYYVPEEGEPEKLDTAEAEEGVVAFDAEHFSVYVVTSSDTVVASGTIDNGEGEADAITWTIYEDETGTRTLVFSGTGSIPDYTSGGGIDTPWYSYAYNSYTVDNTTHRGLNLVIEDGITRIGAYAFRNGYYLSLDIGEDVESIGRYAFWYVHSLTSVDIPGNVKTIENYAFFTCYDLASVTLEEGVESIGTWAFGYSSLDVSYTVYLPSSVTYVGGGAFLNASGYAFQENGTVTTTTEGYQTNGTYTIVDGVLYSADLKTLADYPSKRIADSYTILAGTTMVQGSALSYITGTKEIVVASTVASYGGTTYVFQHSSGLESVIFEDGAYANAAYMFYSCTNLQSVTLPDTEGLSLSTDYFYGCSSLESITFPDNTVSIGELTRTTSLSSLQTIIYNAENASIANSVFYSANAYDLIIGTDVDVLPANFDSLVSWAGSITLQGPNFITVEEGAFVSASSPYSSLTGYIYVDEYGAIYQINTETNEATLIYVPAGLTEYTIPASIIDTENENNTEYTVTGIGTYALRYAENLKTLIFEDASKITDIADYAMSNCPLESVVDGLDENAETATTVEEALALFTGAITIGYQPFSNTNLGGTSGTGATADEMDGATVLTIVNENNEDAKLTLDFSGGTWEYTTTTDEDGNTSTSTTTGGYSLDTGETLTINITAQAPSATDTYVFRVYLSYTDSDYSLDYVAGNTYSFKLNDGSTVEAECCATEDPNTIYFEFSVPTGTTKSFSITTSYPNVTTDGGGLTVWGEVLTSEEAETAGTAVQPKDSTDTLQAWWVYEPDTYTVQKTNTGNQTTMTLSASDGEIRFSASLNYTITTNLEGDTKTYGRDFVTSVSYEDVLTLPDGVEWDEDVLEAIKAGMVYYSSGTLYIYDSENNKVNIAKVSLTSVDGVSIRGVQLKWVSDEDAEGDGYVVLCWTLQNTSDGNLSSNTVSINIYPAATVITDTSRLNQTTTNEDGNETTVTSVILNEVTGTFHYTYSADATDSDTAEKTINVENGTIELSKSATSATYFGEDVTYTLTVYNSKGLDYTASKDGIYTLTDTLDTETYISAESMEAMFQAAAEMDIPLVITIENAVLGVNSTATDASGTGTVNLNSGNTSSENETAVTLTITCIVSGGSDEEDSDAEESENTDSQYAYSYVVTYTDGNGNEQVKSGDNLASILQALGYGVTSSAVYTCTWTLGGGETEKYTLAGGESLVFEIPATVKTTFQLMNGKDWPNQYSSTSASAVNNAYIDTTSQTNHVKSASATTKVYREAYIRKSVYDANGNQLSSNPSADSGSMLEYVLTFEHKGSGEYEDLPMVDDLYGSQLLLVPFAQNANNTSITSGNNVRSYDSDDDGDYDYYILGVGTYSDVVVGQDANGNYLTAATITVEEITDGTVTFNNVDEGTTSYSYSGYHTQIKWYYDSLAGESYTMSVRYQVLVEYGDTVSYSIGNVVWMNDREGSRIFDTIWGGGTIIDFEKDIVVESDNDNETKVDSDGDGLDDDDYSSVSQGESVTYCLTLSGHDGGTFTLTGGNLADLLPDTANIFEWEKNVNVELYYTCDDSITISGGTSSDTESNDSEESETSGLNSWYIGSSYGGASGTYILWPEDLSIEFNGSGTLKIYVTLTFPSNTEADDDTEGTTTWTDYVDAVGGMTLENTLYVYSFTSAVTHELIEEGRVLLQKGVYGEATSIPSVSSGYTPTDVDLNYFNTEDSYRRYVVYYVTLYNDGNTKFYLSDLTDILPDGYTFVQLVGSTSGLLNGGTYQSNSTQYAVQVTGGTSTNNILISGLPSGTVYRSAAITRSTQDGNTVTFTATGTSDEYSLKYDEDREMYYLDKGEALVFGYICQVGTEDETGDEAVNTISMDYYDYLNAGVEQVTDYNVTGQDVTYSGKTYYDTSNNDGDRKAEKDESTGTVTLSSTVKQVLGDIIPGIAKMVESYTNSSGTTTAYSNSVTGSNGETINWKATLYNNGQRAINGYTVTDTMPSPYVFEGAVTMSVYTSSGSSISGLTLFTIGSRSENDEKVTITSGSTTYELTIGGDAVEVKYNNNYSMMVSISKDDDGNEVLTIVFADDYFSIPEGGYIELRYSSRNPSNSVTYTTYVNSVTLTPNQEFSEKYEGIAGYDEEGNMTSVTANAAITVAGAYGTSSSKSVVELETDSDGSLVETTNSASSESSNNSIVLSSTDSIFRYTLTVNNVTEKAMTKLVLIDTLPEEGDTYAVGSTERGSEFTVNLAKDADFVVTVISTNENNEQVVTTLSTGDYTIEYSESTNITSGDYAGNEDEKWSTSYSDITKVRSVRIIITDEGATKIPAGATVTVSFNAVAYAADGTSIDPGAIAWNNFGYHYALKDVTTELTAMPLVVGVQVPSAPELTKKLVDLDGNAYAVDEETTFTFVVYKGSELKDTEGNSYTSQEALTDALAALETDSDSSNDRAYKVVTITVGKDSSSSGSVSLSGEGWSGWTWTEGETYTITEFLEDETYVFKGWSATNTTSGDAASGNSYTFTYDREKTLYLTCENTYQLWSLDLTKVDEDSYNKSTETYDTTLSGAVFALYSKTNNSVTDNSAANQIEVGEETWYLYSVKTTDDNGQISWISLTEDSYYLVEIEAPDGYNLNAEPVLVSRDSNTQSITIENEAGYELPESGGAGTRMFGLIGLILCAGASLILYLRRKMVWN